MEPGAPGRRIVIVGASGTGKSRLARELGRRLRLPVVHLDPVYWRPGYVETPMEEMRETTRRLAAPPAWIIEGAGSRTAAETADTLVFLDLPRRVYLFRFLRRWLLGRLRPPAPDRPPFGETLRGPSWRWVWGWHRVGRPQVVELAERAASRGVRLFWLRSARDVHAFIATAGRPTRRARRG
jgi:hypothetical protein